MGVQRLLEPVLLEVLRAQFEDQRAHFGQRLPLQLLELAELGANTLGVLVEQELQAAGGEPDREERLGHRVVELARQVGALLGGGKVGRLVAQLRLEPLAGADVAHRAVRPDEATIYGLRDPRRLGRDRMAVAMLEVEPVDALRLSLGDHSFPLLGNLLAAAWVHQLAEMLADQLIGPPAGKVLDRVRHVGERAVGLRRPDRVRRVLDEVPIALLGALELRDQAGVGNRHCRLVSERPEHLRILVAPRIRAMGIHQDRAQRALLADEGSRDDGVDPALADPAIGGRRVVEGRVVEVVACPHHPALGQRAAADPLVRLGEVR